MVRSFRLLIFSWALVGLAVFGKAQTTAYQLSVAIAAEGSDTIRETYELPDSLAVYRFSRKLIDSLQWEGFLDVEDSLQFFGEKKASLFLNAGPQYTWLYLGRGNLEPWMLPSSSRMGFPTQGKPFRFRELRSIIDEILNRGQNTGYPFIAVSLDSVRLSQDQVAAGLQVDKGPWISFDTLRITGDSRTQPLFLSRKLRMAPGEPFSQKRVDQALDAVRNTPYLRLDGAPELSFQNEEATVYLPVNDRKINRLDGIIGLLPNEIEANKWLVTGQFDVHLANVSGKGRDYSLNWQRLSQYSQNLRVAGREPFLFGSQLDLGISFAFLKEDTTFLNREFELHVGYQLAAKTYLTFFGKRQAGDLLDVSRYSDASELPEIADYRYTNYGATVDFSDLDDILMPRSGWRGLLRLGIGNKRLVENTGLPQELYEEAQQNTLQYYVRGNLQRYFRWNQSLSTKLSLDAGDMYNSNLFLNDLFRLGGLKSIRGFNENFFYASRYAYLTVEPRYYIGNESYFLLFSDIGMLENRVSGQAKEWPIALGGGLSLETSGGIFTFVYALGQAANQPMTVAYSRVHFGFTSRF